MPQHESGSRTSRHTLLHASRPCTGHRRFFLVLYRKRNQPNPLSLSLASETGIPSGIQRPRDIASLRAHTRLPRFLVPYSTELASIFAGIVTGADIPDHWRKGRVALILKLQDLKLQDHRSLTTATSVLNRTFAQVLKDWTAGWVESEHILTELQNGFCSTSSLSHSLRRLRGKRAANFSAAFSTLSSPMIMPHTAPCLPAWLSALLPAIQRLYAGSLSDSKTQTKSVGLVEAGCSPQKDPARDVRCGSSRHGVTCHSYW